MHLRQARRRRPAPGPRTNHVRAGRQRGPSRRNAPRLIDELACPGKVITHFSCGSLPKKALHFAAAPILGPSPSPRLAYRRSAYGVTRALLASQSRVPWRLVKFLDDAHRVGVLRQVGNAYQLVALSIKVTASTVWEVLKEHDNPPAPERHAVQSRTKARPRLLSRAKRRRVTGAAPPAR